MNGDVRFLTLVGVDDEITIRESPLLQHDTAYRPLSQREDGNSLEICFLTIYGMTCSSCVDSIQRNLLKMEGIHSVLVSLLAQRAEVKYDPAHFLPNQIIPLIEKLGFQAELLDKGARGMETIDVNVRTTELERFKRTLSYCRSKA